MGDIEDIVNKCEELCDELENVPQTVIDGLCIKNYYLNTKCVLSIPATIANVRLFYYVKSRHEICNKIAFSAFEQLRFILTNDQSNWCNLNDNEKISFIKSQIDITNHVLIFT